MDLIGIGLSRNRTAYQLALLAKKAVLGRRWLNYDVLISTNLRSRDFLMKAISDYAPYESIICVQTVMVPMAKSIGSKQEVIKEVEQSAAPMVATIGGRRASAALYRGDG